MLRPMAEDAETLERAFARSALAMFAVALVPLVYLGNVYLLAGGVMTPVMGLLAAASLALVGLGFGFLRRSPVAVTGAIAFVAMVVVASGVVLALGLSEASGVVIWALGALVTLPWFLRLRRLARA